MLLDDQVRLRIYRGSRLEIEMPLRPQQALALAGLLLNYALMVRERADRMVLRRHASKGLQGNPEVHGPDIGVSLNKRRTYLFHLSLKPVPHIDADRALRGALKVLLRGFGLRLHRNQGRAIMRIDRLDLTNWVPALRTAADCCIRTTDQPAGALCIGVAGTVHATLKTLRSPMRARCGAAIYRAGPHEMLDVIAFCGRGNRPEPKLQLFHAWVEARASNGAKWLLDFTPKYWQASEHRMGEVTIPGVKLPPIKWVVSPPEQFIGPMAQIVYRLKHGERTPLWVALH